jgi:hypothetical protein
LTRKKTLKPYTKPSPNASIKPPAYIDKCVLQEIESRHLRLMPSMGEILRLKRGTYSEFCYVSMKNDGDRIEGIEVPRRSSYSHYASNVAIIHELGHAMDSERLRFMSRYTQEKHAWKNAEKIRDSIGYPVQDEQTGETWGHIRDAAMKSYENFHITKHDVLEFLSSSFMVWFALDVLMLIFGAILAAVYSDVFTSEPVAYILYIFQCCLLFLLPAVLLAFIFSDAGTIIRNKFFGIQTNE